MADDMRIKAYPPLPPKGGPRVAIVLPTTGDLCLRSQLPDAFQQQLIIHADAASYRFYARFVVLRKFIVMSSEGDLYTQTVRTSLEFHDLPRQQLLPLPSISPWDIIKILDLVQCFTENASWELVRVRWQSGMVTWLPIELLQRNFGNLLQEFYVNTINSWGFRERIFAHSVRNFKTEVECWLHHDEFRQFYQYLRRRRAMAATPQLTESDVKPALNRPAQQNQPQKQVPSRPQQVFTSTNHNRSHQEQQRPLPPSAPAARVVQDRRAELITTNTARPQPTIPSRQQQAPAVEKVRARVNASATNQRAPPPRQSADGGQNRVRKRLERVESADPDSGDEGQHSPAPEAAANFQRRTADTSSESKATEVSATLKRFKRLRKQHLESAEESADSDDEIVLRVLAPKSQVDQPKSSTSPASAPTATADAAVRGGGASADSGDFLLPVSDDEDDDAEQDSSVSPVILGEIRCVCGADSVGTYAGRWLHCWNDECGAWEHADCVGVIGSKDCAMRYSCVKCDPAAYKSRITSARDRLAEWLFQCCDSKNGVQLLKLLVENTGGQEKKKGWRHPNEPGVNLLMKAARFGLTKCVRHLVEVAKVDVFATDASSLNALHHAVLGGRPRSVLYLLNQEPKLLGHQDKKGRTPFHLMLESRSLNEICLSLLKKDPQLATVGDLAANSSLHYACRAITKPTVEICQLLLQTQPALVHEKSSDGLLPFHLLCKAAAPASNSKISLTEAALIVKGIVKLMLDIDVLGTFIDDRAPNGWRGLHFAAASGNHELVAYLCSSEFVDVHATTTDSSETALHIAAKGGYHLSVRTLLRMGARPTAKDYRGWIPMLRAENAACIQELLSYKLTKQLSRLNRMAARFELKEIVDQWKRRVVTDPTCFDLLNDWCQCDLERIERMGRIFLNNPYLLRLDNKLDYFEQVLFPMLKESAGIETATHETTEPSAADPASRPRRKGIKFVFSSSNESYWAQFVCIAKHLEPENFRAPMQFTTDRAPADDATSGDNFVLKLVLIRLLRTLSVKAPGFLVRKASASDDNSLQPHSEQEQRDKLLDFYLLGELVAHLVLYGVSLSGILDFSPSFLRCAFGLDAEAGEASDPQWLLLGRSFIGGFEHVIPSGLKILHPEEFRVLTHGRANMLSARAVDWESTMDWSSYPTSVETRAWLSRLVSELVVEEQQLLLLMLVETFSAAYQQFFLVGDDGLAAAPERLIRVLKHSPTEDEDDDTASASHCGALMPHMGHKAHAITLPQYSDYAAFRSAMLRLIRHADQAFRRK